MFDYGQAAEPLSPVPTRARGTESSLARLAPLLALGRRHFGTVAASMLACGALAFAGSKLVTPRYVSTAEIYVDPSALQGGDTQPIAAGQDSNGFVNYVESQALIVSSRAVLDRVVKAENLARDPEFSGAGGPSTIGAFFHSPAPASPDDGLAAAARALGAKVQVKRPERTFVLEVSVASRDPARAAELANATAKAYIDEVNAMRFDGSRQAGAAIAQRLDSLRQHVLDAERAIEDYKGANGLIGARDTSLIEGRLKQLDGQLVAARTRMSEAKARADQVDLARRQGVDLGALATPLGLNGLTPLRAQQADAKQKLADALAELGPRHPQVIDARARLAAANAAVEAEVSRFADAQRLEYARSKSLEASLLRQLDELNKQTNESDQAMIGLRDLERKAAAARDVYELFVNRSREAGEIQQVEPTRTKIISAATPPLGRAFPPSSVSLAALGLVAGLGLGLALAWLGERRGLTVAASFGASGRPKRARSFVVGATAPLRAHARRQSLDNIDLTELGFAALAPEADAGEFDAALDGAGYAPGRGRDAFVVAIAGDNLDGERTSLAINLALSAVRRDARVVLLDAAGRNAKLTRALRNVARRPVLEGGPIFATVNGVSLALPKAADAEVGRLKPEALLGEFLRKRADAPDLIVCDGPDISEVDAGTLLRRVSAIVVVENGEANVSDAALAEMGLAASAYVRFAAPADVLRRGA